MSNSFRARGPSFFASFFRVFFSRLFFASFFRVFFLRLFFASFFCVFFFASFFAHLSKVMTQMALPWSYRLATFVGRLKIDVDGLVSKTTGNLVGGLDYKDVKSGSFIVDCGIPNLNSNLNLVVIFQAKSLYSNERTNCQLKFIQKIFLIILNSAQPTDLLETSKKKGFSII